MICQQIKLIRPFVFESFYENIDLYSEDEVIVRPLKLSVCKADMRYYFGERGAEVLRQRLPMSLIHEACGEVVFDRKNDFKRGARVVLLPNIAGKDRFYDENYRPDSKFRSSRADGFMRELISMKREQVVPYSDILSDSVTAFTEFISVGVHSADSFDRVAHERRDRIAVWGDGSLSYVVCCLLKNKFPKTRLTVIGINTAKLQYFSFADDILTVNQVEKGAGFDHCFECVGGRSSGAAIDQMIDTINPQGTIMLLGVSEEPVPINTRMVLEKGLTLLGRSRSRREDFESAVKFLESSQVFRQRMSHLISEEIRVTSIKEMNEALSLARSADFKVVMDWEI